MTTTKPASSSARKSQKRLSKLRDIKYLIGTFSVLGTLGLWSLFSKGDALSTQQEPASNDVEANLGLSPLPTLMTVYYGNTQTEPVTASAPLAVDELRSVTMPTPNPVTVNNAPRVVGGNRSSSSPVTSTRSS